MTTYPCEIKEQATRPILSIRTRTPMENLPQTLGQCYGAIGQYLGAQGKYPAGAPFTAYYNMDMQDMDIEIGFPVAETMPGKDNIQAGELPAGYYASCVYTGPYGDIEPAYNALTQYVQEQGHEVTGVAYEFYLNNPTEVAPASLQTQIVFPLKAK